jgi:hypothetical protein
MILKFCSLCARCFLPAAAWLRRFDAWLCWVQQAWAEHKKQHKKEPDDWLYCTQKGRGRSKALPDFSWTGDLRPDKIGPKRSVPAGIPKPDYAKTGNPDSELRSRQQHSGAQTAVSSGPASNGASPVSWLNPHRTALFSSGNQQTCYLALSAGACKLCFTVVQTLDALHLPTDTDYVAWVCGCERWSRPVCASTIA